MIAINPTINFSKLAEDAEISFVPMELVDENYGTIKSMGTKKRIDSKGFTKFQEGDLLWAKITPCMQNGKSAIAENLVNGLGCGSTEFFVLRPKTDKIRTKYIHLILRDERILQNAENFFGGSAGQQRVSKDFLLQLPIPVPPEAVQEQVIKIMDDAYEAKRRMEQEAKDLLDSINGYLLEELGIALPPEEENTLGNRVFRVSSEQVLGGRFDPFFWKPFHKLQEENIYSSMHQKLKLMDLATFETGVVYSADRERDSGHGILRANNISLSNNALDLSDIRYIDEALELQDSKRLYANDIFMCSASGSKEHAGKVAFIEKNLPYYYGGFMAVIRVSSDACVPRFLFEYMASSIFRSALFRLLGGTNINNVTGDMLNKIPIALPAVNMQEMIVAHIVQIRLKVRELEQQAKTVLDTAKAQVEKILLEGSL